FLITSNHPEFSQTGLKLDSKVRVSRIITIERSLIVRKIGYLDINLSYQLNQCLKQAFQL
ncbi:MAG: type II toxin-antitoxin system PemK/MazF family toxin, partial [Gomphosphaeria aponina SAG 52.96 = DSM 107014]|nr:type II toxin-antitoxin system PemK/MazF family toxin [Gomphosphaeria aponina SAG 52.96 = DSM 107014]